MIVVERVIVGVAPPLDEPANPLAVAIVMVVTLFVEIAPQGKLIVGTAMLQQVMVTFYILKIYPVLNRLEAVAFHSRAANPFTAASVVKAPRIIHTAIVIHVIICDEQIVTFCPATGLLGILTVNATSVPAGSIIYDISPA